MSWKEDFHKAVLDYINTRYHVNAVHLVEVYDMATPYENSCGGCDSNYSCDIVYINERGTHSLVTYEGRFSSLIEDLTDS